MLRISVPIAIFASMTLCAQSGVVSGRVVSAKAQDSLPASITVITGPGIRIKSVPTDARGMFTVEAAPGRAVIIVRADGYASEQREVAVVPGWSNLRLNFALSPAGSLSGRVVDLAGSAVAGARVWLQYNGDRHAWHFAEEAGGEPADELGNFTIPVVARGRSFVLHAESDAWLLSSSQTMTIRETQRSGIVLVLNRRGATVSGRVLDAAGRPVSGAQVQLRARPAQGEFTAEQRASVPFARSAIRLDVSREDGSYAFRGLPPGRVVVTAQTQDLRAASEIDISSGGQTAIDLSLR
jgi:protocatechuate 3,4-dioxygenase beta subunit